MNSERLRVSEKLKGRIAQASALALVVAGTAAIAAPVVHRANLTAARTDVFAVVQQAAGLAAEFPTPQAERLVWEGVDIDGDGQADFANPTGQDTRKVDAYGFGEFGASRDGGSRRHEGVDFIADAGQKIVSPISGYVTKIGYAYAGDSNLKFVEITNPALHYAARVFYIDPTVVVGQTVALGHAIGTHRTLETKYPGGMTDHVHLEIIDKRGRRIDATQVIEARYEVVGRARG
ncbi:M23 family metallopeptidase [Phenylobacterium deserti]|uniref:M23 family peptidase n=1 Tax=Phenylobacterium deserti TaxID=1914756 RepID=A0A328AA50_9CAUL|nr:M23 family metallopeptidase [Phenylobacterium deserti]RAK51542.1 M23 family peptidase [Phenylobacterium deserti]